MGVSFFAAVQPRYISLQNLAQREMADPPVKPHGQPGLQLHCTTSGFAQKKRTQSPSAGGG
jgi:hypothetical protein